MALVKATLVQALKAATAAAELSGKAGDSPAVTQDKWAEAMATAIDAYIKSGTVTVTVATTGTAAAQAGSGTGNIS